MCFYRIEEPIPLHDLSFCHSSKQTTILANVVGWYHVTPATATAYCMLRVVQRWYCYVDVRGDDSDFSPFVGKPQVEGVMKHSSKFPSVKIPRFVSSRTPEMISRWWSEQWRRSQLRVAYFTWTCTQTQITLFPTKFREVVNLSGLVVYKGSNTRDNDSNWK